MCVILKLFNNHVCPWAEGIMFLGCVFVYAYMVVCVLVWAEAFSDWLSSLLVSSTPQIDEELSVNDFSYAKKFLFVNSHMKGN